MLFSWATETLWRAVGRALKRVDRGLMSVWFRWTNGVFSTSQCAAEWDSFPPISCDTHAPASDVRDTFLKVLQQRNINLPAAFRAAVSFYDHSRCRTCSLYSSCSPLLLLLLLSLRWLRSSLCSIRDVFQFAVFLET
jgi:hypothetical protein